MGTILLILFTILLLIILWYLPNGNINKMLRIYRIKSFIRRRLRKWKAQTLSKEHRMYWNAIDEILWNDWDPIGINDIAPRDEYSSYTPIIYGLTINDANAETIANKLNEIETNLKKKLKEYETAKRS